MNILIVGAGGFIGRHAVQYLAEAGWKVYGIDRVAPPGLANFCTDWYQLELPDAQFESIIRKRRPDVLLHAAGTASVGQSVAAPLSDFENSVRLWANVIEAVRRSQVDARVIFLSSAAVYGDPERLPVAETARLAPVSPYGYHKKFCEEISQYYARLFGLAVCSLRIFSAYGPTLRQQVIWDICQKAKRGKIIELMGTGDESRDFIHISDIVQAITLLAEHGDFQAGVYNVASGVSTTIRKLAECLAREMGNDCGVRFNGQRRSGDPVRWEADISSITNLGFRSQVSLQDGLSAYVKWILGEGNTL